MLNRLSIRGDDMKSKGKTIKLTPVSTLHYIRLVYRSALFIALIILYIKHIVYGGEDVQQYLESRPLIIMTIWTVFTVEMIIRFFPSKLESPGCQKQFARNYIRTGNVNIDIQDNNGVMLAALIWIMFNGIFGALHMMGILDDGIMLILCCAYSVCDIICILFFCPFQSWILKNKCCSTCRIYNWDYAMMFTPLFFVKRTYTWSLLVMSVILMLRWEITFFRYPERFAESTNGYLGCANCTEKLCTHKNQLRRLWVHISEYTDARIRKLKGNPADNDTGS